MFGSQRDPAMRVVDFPPPSVLAALKNPTTDLNLYNQPSCKALDPSTP